MDELKALQPERIMISPGPCTPNEAGISVAAIRLFTGKIRILGICLGLQLLFESSDEGSRRGLGLLGGQAYSTMLDLRAAPETLCP